MDAIRTRRDAAGGRTRSGSGRPARDLDAPPHWYVAAARLRRRVARQLELISTPPTTRPGRS